MPTASRRYALDLAGLNVPVIELTGAQDGPLLTVIAGVHGCEYAPMAAVRQWAAQLAERDLRGSVRIVPVLNLPAFTARSPFVVPQDGKNLNRCFPGDPAGTLAERLACDAFTKLITESDALVDAHAGDLPEALEPFALYDAGPRESEALALARAYGLGYVIRQEPGPGRAVAGTTSAAAAEAGIPAIIAEAGGRGIIERAAVELHVRGLEGVLAALGMADSPSAGSGGQPAARPPSSQLASSGSQPRPEQPDGPVVLQRFIWMRSEATGWWEPAVQTGEHVARGQLLGTVTSLDGAEVRQVISAPVPGVLIFMTISPAVEADGLLLGLGAS